MTENPWVIFTKQLRKCCDFHIYVSYVKPSRNLCYKFYTFQFFCWLDFLYSIIFLRVHKKLTFGPFHIFSNVFSYKAFLKLAVYHYMAGDLRMSVLNVNCAAISSRYITSLLICIKLSPAIHDAEHPQLYLGKNTSTAEVNVHHYKFCAELSVNRVP